VDAFFGRDENTKGVPLTGRFGGVNAFLWFVELIKPSRFLWVFTFWVV